MARFDLRWWHAHANLAWRALLHLASRVWPWRRRRGLVRFQQNYLHEGLPSATASLRMHAHELGRCTLCHACDDVCPLLRTLPSAEFTGPMGFVVAGARSATHLADVEGTLRLMVGDDCRACRACARACPEGIPILRLAELLLGQHAAIEGARVRALQQPTSI